MKYWLTTHWPHERSKPAQSPHRGVWVAEGKREVIAPMKSGDLVWTYESQSGRDIKREGADGSHEVLRRHVGRGGVVTLGEVVDVPHDDPDREIESYTDGSSIWWRWHAPTTVRNSAGFVPRSVLNEILNYKPSHSLRGFGERRSGLKEISRRTHEEIRQRFLQSVEEHDADRLRAAKVGRFGGRGGEGPVHLRLKEAIARDPGEILGEDGLSLVQMEYPFAATGDRIDVLLKDANGQYVAVEVEPECPPEHMAGPLQCMKYRALLAYHMGRELEEVRTILVSHRIAPAVGVKARRYGLEAIEVPVDAVGSDSTKSTLKALL